MTALLASVVSAEEAGLARAAGVDLIDFKDPAAGALGALPPEVIRSARAGLTVATSATAGDLPCRAEDWIPAVRTMAATGVDYVKLGLFPGSDPAAALAALGPLSAAGVQVVVVLFADRDPDFGWLGPIRDAGCAGAMLDTAGKTGGRLLDHLDEAALGRFVHRARTLGLLSGLAGSLALADIPRLLPLAPDYLGFRGALCRGGRDGVLDPAALARVRAAIPAATRAVS
ncbi:MAG: (5-formylfuran-3-yl)methyl phosphate synthase [Candidatus Competibacterales bacterium]|nr:(5-formylfuran-3-yl)methyl phosphate synthase [Candidatus Competibacterales bacterium]